MRRVSDVNRDVPSTHDWGLIGCNDSFSGECIRIIGDNFDRRGNGGVVVNHIDIEPNTHCNLLSQDCNFS